MVQRRTMGRRAAVRLARVLGAAGAGAALLTSRPSAAAGAGGGSAIIGSWLVESPGPSTRLLQTYSADGAHLAVHDEHPMHSPQLGAWTQVGERQFLMRGISFRFDFDAQGRRTGSIDVRALYTVDPGGDTMTGRGTRLELDLAGTLLEPPIAWTSRATRITPIPLD